MWSSELADAFFLDRVEDFGDYWHLPSMARGLGRMAFSPAVVNWHKENNMVVYKSCRDLRESTVEGDHSRAIE